MKSKVACTFLLSISLLLVSEVAGQPRPPLAPRESVSDTLHGVVVADPFRSLETGSGPNVQTWIRDQDKYARAFAAASPRYHDIETAVQAIAEATVFTPPLRRGRAEFYSTFKASGPAAAIDIYVRRHPRASAMLLPGLEHHRRTAGETALLYQPSPDGRFVAVGFAKTGTSWVRLRIFRVSDGALLPDSMPPFYRALGTIDWATSGEGFFYDHFSPDSSGGGRGVTSGSVRYHRLSSTEDEVVFSPPEERNLVVGHSQSPTGHFVVIHVTNTDTRATRLWVKDLRRAASTLDSIPLLGAGTYAFAGELADRLYFLTWAGAARGRVVCWDPATGKWTEVVPERDDPISTWAGLGASVLGGGILIAYVHDSQIQPRFVGPDGSGLRSIALPKLGSIWTGFVGDPNSDQAFYQLQGMADPGTVYRLDLKTGRSTPYLKPKLQFDPDQLVTERTLFPAKDGAQVPIHIVHRAGQKLDGSAPLILYGYGFQGWIASPWFQPAMAYWVSQGGVWAVAGVRGGGEFGEKWQDAGARRNKQTGIDDYLAATEWLIAKGYTAADRMVANASSAGGPLVAAAIIQRPALFRAAIFDYSVFDMLRYDQYSHARHWQSDYGTASNPQDFEALRHYSPYHNVREGQCYPAVLTTPGELDRTAPPFHSYKFVAALQSARPSCDRPALVRVSWGAGHAAGATAADASQTWTDELAFLDRVLPPGSWPGARP